MVGAAVVLRDPPPELAPGEDHHPLLRIAVRGLHAREVVVEGADRAAQGPHEIGMIQCLVAVRVPAAEAREEDFGRKSRSEHLSDQLQLVGEGGAEVGAVGALERVVGVSGIGHRGSPRRQGAVGAESVLGVEEQLSRERGRGVVQRRCRIGSGGSDGSGESVFEQLWIVGSADACGTEPGGIHETAGAGNGGEAAGGSAQHHRAVGGDGQSAEHVAADVERLVCEPAQPSGAARLRGAGLEVGDGRQLYPDARRVRFLSGAGQ